MQWHIGCSGFHYRDWKDIFYPPGLPQRKWFDYYATRFDCLELNVTFYRFPQLKFLQTWYEASPSHFRFAVKAPRLITHYKQFKDCKRMLGDFYGTCAEGLREKLAAVLFQLPPQFAFTPERLDMLAENMNPAFRNVIEFRHDTWWKGGVYSRFRKEGLIFCGISHPSLPDDTVVTNSCAYYRFHGVPKLYYSRYKRLYVQEIADRLAGNPKVREAFVFFNNTATQAAIKNAMWLGKYTGKK